MALLIFTGYVLAEALAFGAVAHYAGVMWALVALLASSGAGLLLLGGQYRRVIAGLRAALDGQRGPGAALADGALVALGAAALVIPGFLTTAAGLLLLTPPGRWLLRPLVLAAAARKLTVMRAGPVVIDGTVADSATMRPRALEK